MPIDLLTSTHQRNPVVDDEFYIEKNSTARLGSTVHRTGDLQLTKEPSKSHVSHLGSGID